MMDARTRLLTALERKGEPDRVPSFVEGMMGEFKENTIDQYGDDIADEDVLLVNGDWTLFKFYKFDAAWLHASPVRYLPLRDLDTPMGAGNATGHRYRDGDPDVRVDRWGRVNRRSSTGHYKYQTGYLNTEDAWNEWIDAGYFDIEVDTRWVDSWAKGYPQLLDEGLVPVPVITCFEPIREAFDFGRFSHFYRKKPAFLKMLASKVTANLLETAKGWCDAGFEVVTWADDCAYKGRVMFPPAVFDELVAPIYKTLNDYCHRRGVLTFFHSDGFTEPFFDGLIASGFDGIQSLEPAAGMDLKHLKDTYGDRVCLIGNIDCSVLLPYGTVDEVAAAVKQCLRDAAAGGGYVFGPTTDIIDSARPENVKAMMDTFIKHNAYPIRV